MSDSKITRRGFISSAAMLAGSVAAGVRLAKAAATPQPADKTNNCRFVFATDSHLMVDNKLRSGDGLTAAFQAIESLKPDFILFGGDLTHESPELDFPAAEELIDRFLKIWKETTSLETRFTFGNHDLVGTRNKSVDRNDPRFGKGLFRMKLSIERDFYSFRKSGWRFVILDNVLPESDGSYIGEFAEEQLAFLRDELKTEPEIPTILCGHIPSVSILPNLGEAGEVVEGRTSFEVPASLVVHNTARLHDVVVETRANVKAVLAGHLHHMEKIEVDGVVYINAGAICGNWWKGLQHGCPEGFLVVNLREDGSVTTDYQSYGWKASV